MSEEHSAGRPVPESVAIVAMGASFKTYVGLCSKAGDRRLIAAETWAINSMGGVIQHDLLFHMDDCRIQEARAARTPDSNVAGLIKMVAKHPRFITSTVYADYPGAIAFPFQDVIRVLGMAYFNNTVAYALAYAIAIGVKKIKLFGCDFSYADGHQAEKGRGCLEFWTGYAMAKGTHIEVAQDSTLLDACVEENVRFYGYDACDVVITNDLAGVPCVEFKQRVTLPSAEEMEIRYNHETPPKVS